MDPELKKLLDQYAAAGASDAELLEVAKAWKTQHATASAQPPVTPHGTSGTWGGPQPKQNPLAIPAIARNAPPREDVMGAARELGATALGMALPETKIATALDAVPGVGPFVAKAITRLGTGALTGAVAAGPGHRQSGAKTGAILGPIFGGVGDAVVAKATPLATKLAAKGMDYANLRDVLHGSVDATNAENYGRALGNAAGREATPAIQGVLNDPYMAQHIAAIRALPQMQGVPETSPQFLHALYKRLSDIEGGAITGLESVEARNPNTKAETQEAARTLKDRLLSAMETAGEKPPITFDVPAETRTVEPRITPGREPQRGPVLPGTAGRAMGDQSQVAMDANGRAVAVSPRDVQGPAGPAFQLRAQPNVVKPGIVAQTPAMRIQTAPGKPVSAYMPEYRGAVDQAREGFAQLDALQKGYEALPALAKTTQMTPQQVEEFSIPSLQNFLNGKSPETAEQLRTGIQASNNANKLVGFKRVLGPIGVPTLNATAKTAPKVLRALGDAGQIARDQAAGDANNAARNGFLAWLITQGYLPADTTASRGTPP